MTKQRPCGTIYRSRARRVEAIQYTGDPQAIMYFVGRGLSVSAGGNIEIFEDCEGWLLRKGNYLVYEDKKFRVMSKHDFDLVFRSPPLKITCRSCQTGAEHSS